MINTIFYIRQQFARKSVYAGDDIENCACTHALEKKNVDMPKHFLLERSELLKIGVDDMQAYYDNVMPSLDETQKRQLLAQLRAVKNRVYAKKKRQSDKARLLDMQRTMDYLKDSYTILLKEHRKLAIRMEDLEQNIAYYVSSSSPSEELDVVQNLPEPLFMQ